MKKKNELRDHLSFKETMADFRASVKDLLLLNKEWLTDYGRVILPIVLFVCIIATVFVALSARSRVEAAAREAEEALAESKTEVVEVTETEFEVDAYPEINLMFEEYYAALGDGDIDGLALIQGTVSETEELRLQAMGPYIDRYDDIVVYTKPGPYIDTYIAYVTVNVYLKEQETCTPGLQAFYVCKDENGAFYINTSELTEEEANYIADIAGQADVVDLQNTINVQYTELMDENEELKNYWAQISVEIDSSVGETLTEEAVEQAKLEEEAAAREQAAKDDDPDSEENNGTAAETTVIRTVTTTDDVNVRKSASATADKLGYAYAGTTFDVIETMTNGWTKIDYNGTEAYIKSEFLWETETVVTTGGDDTSTSGTTTYIYAVGALNVRSEPSATATKVGVLSDGDSVELIEESDGWSKIRYNGTIAYVKSEYTEKK